MAAIYRDEGIPIGGSKFDILNTLSSGEDGSSTESEISDEERFVDHIPDAEVS